MYSSDSFRLHIYPVFPLQGSSSPPSLSGSDACSDPPVGGRLRHFLSRDSWEPVLGRFLSTLSRGLRLEFHTPPLPLTREPIQFTLPPSLAKRLAFVDQIQVLLDKTIIEPVHNPSSLGFYSVLFLVPKGSGGSRLVIALSHLNRFLEISSFSMETAEFIRGALGKGDLLTSLDLTDASFHVPIHRSSRKYLRFATMGHVFQFRALPFGLSSVPWAFSRIVSKVKLELRCHGLQLFQYLDHWLLVAPSSHHASRWTHDLLTLCQDLGFLINLPKSDLLPSQDLIFLGYHFQLVPWKVLPTPERIVRIQQSVGLFLTADGATAHD